MTVATVGTNLISGAYDFFNKPKLQTPAWGQAAAMYSNFMREETGEAEEEAISRARLEAERSGVGSGAAYLETVRGIEEQRNKILSREISRFDIQLEMEKMKWGEQASMVQYQQDVGLKERTMQRMENIGGAIASQFQEGYGEEKTREYRTWFKDMYKTVSGMGDMNQEIKMFKEYMLEMQDTMEKMGGKSYKEWKEEQKAKELGNIDTLQNNAPTSFLS